MLSGDFDGFLGKISITEMSCHYVCPHEIDKVSQQGMDTVIYLCDRPID